MNTLDDLTAAAGLLATERAGLLEMASALNAEIEALKAAKLRFLTARAAKVRELHAQLEALIKSSPQLFVKPRTVTAHGIKFGLQKGKGGLEWEDDEKLVEAIRKQFDEAQAETLLTVTTSPDRKALDKLSAAELKKLGVNIRNATDRPLIAAEDTTLDKLVASLLSQPA